MAARSRWSSPWGERPREEAALFNPAFCGELLTRAADGHRRIRGTPMPLTLAFLVLPLVLNQATRSGLPRRYTTTLGGWMAAHQATLAFLPGQVLQFRPVTREALMFSIQTGMLRLGAEGLEAGMHPLSPSSRLQATTDETEDARRSAGLVGRWFAHQPGPLTILQSLGVRP